MLSWQDCWQKGAQMLQVGMKHQLLNESTCIELSHDQATRDSQIAANQKLIQEAQGALAPIHGEERFLSLSSSHTTAFLRAIEHGCQAPEGVTIQQEIPKDDPAWKLISQGWTWLVISQVAESTWPMLPGILQSALNSSNAIAKEPNELELAAQLANMLKHNMSMPDAKVKLLASTTVDIEVLHNVGHFVLHYAGGPAFPFIDFLQKFSTLTALAFSQIICIRN